MQNRIIICAVSVAVMSSPVSAMSHAEAYKAEFVAACETQMNAPAATCDCMADKALAHEDINDVQRDWLVLAMNEDPQAVSMAATMNATEAMGATMFLVTAPQQCASGQ